jgi:hypothetical protein
MSFPPVNANVKPEKKARRRRKKYAGKRVNIKAILNKTRQK